MRNVQIIILLCLCVISCSTLKNVTPEKIYVVERERESLFVYDQGVSKSITDLGNLNHATMKFKWGNGFLLARDGNLSKIDIVNDVLIKKVKIGKSGIGLTFTDKYIVIVNYDPHSVVILDQNLDIVHTLPTQSRNVGVKNYKNYLVFSLMDKNEIWVLDINKNFEIVKKIQNVGNLPFDALIQGKNYLVGFFNEPSIGFLDLEDFSYNKIEMKGVDPSLVYKVPHFGYWGIINGQAFVPLTSQKKLLVIDLNTKKTTNEIPLAGEPVFAAVSPDKNNLVVNFSGEMENFLSVIDTNKKVVINTFEAGRRIMHLRFSTHGEEMFVTSYFENELKIFNVSSWSMLSNMKVATPSGIFLNTVVE